MKLIRDNEVYSTSGVLNRAKYNYLKFEESGFYGFYNIVKKINGSFYNLARIDIFQIGKSNYWEYGDCTEIVGYEVFDDSVKTYKGIYVNMSINHLKSRLVNYGRIENSIYTVTKDGRLYLYDIGDSNKIKSIRMLRKDDLCIFSKWNIENMRATMQPTSTLLTSGCVATHVV